VRSPRIALAVAALALAGCGYRVTGRGGTIPKNIQTVAIPAFQNATTRYRLPELLAGELTREFNTRTRYRVVENRNTADAVLEGSILQVNSNPTIFDPATGRASAVQINAQVQVTLRNRATGEILFTRPSVEIRDRYEISVDPGTYFDETGVALERLSRTAAHAIVSTILEDF
jgi:hypothetical protein